MSPSSEIRKRTALIEPYVVVDTYLDKQVLLHVFQLYEPRQANLVLIAYESSEGSGEPVHPRRLARTFAARSYKH